MSGRGARSGGSVARRAALRVSVAATLFAGLGAAASLAQEQVDAGFRLDFSGEVRARYETLENQFRVGGSGGDQSLSTRELLRGDLTAGRFAGAIELIDARGFLDDEGSYQLGSIVNPLDLLEASVQVALEGPGGSNMIVQAGRFGLAVGSYRFVASGDYGNQIRSFNGVRARAIWESGDAAEAFYTAPSERRPRARAWIDDNEMEADPVSEGLRLWGVHARRAEIAPALSERLSGEAFAIGYEEQDEPGLPTADRRVVDLGGRLLLAPSLGAPDFDLEGAWRTGQARDSADSLDTTDLNVSAVMAHVSLGYTFDRAWAPRAAFDADYASGDGDPDDGEFTRYEGLYGSRRGDFGATSIMGPLSRTNLIAAGGRLQIAPSSRWDARAIWKAAFLADERDIWEEGETVDPTGASGRFLGHVLDARARVWLVPERIQAEFGATAFLRGRFAETAPGTPQEGDAYYGFFQTTAFF